VSGESAPDDFLSGASGYVAGIRRSALARLTDATIDLSQSRQRAALRRAAERWPPRRRVLVLTIFRPDVPNLEAEARRELGGSRHEVRFEAVEVGGAGKFENLNRMLDRSPVTDGDWLLVLDDDVRLPSGFLDNFLFLAERFDLAIAQPAHRSYSHAPGRSLGAGPEASCARRPRGDRAGGGVSGPHILHAAAVPAPQGRLGAGQPLVGAGG